MELTALRTLTGIALLTAVHASADLPRPELHFEKMIVEDDDTTVTCTFPSSDFSNVELTIRGATSPLGRCRWKAGGHPSVSCTVEATREMHEAEFTCQAAFTTRSLPRKMMIQTEPTFTDCPDKLNWVEGQVSSFQCNATGYPKPNVTCERDKAVYKAGETFSVTRNMSGVYICQAMNFDFIKKPVSVSVEYKPEVSGVRVSGPLRNQGDKVEMTCDADGSPDPTFRWDAPSPDYQLSADKRTLTIRSLQESHLGPYTCTAQNKHGANTAGTTLELAVKPSISILSINPSAEVLERSNVTLTCEASGFPRPVLSWNIPGNVKIPKGETTWSIGGVKKEHVGSYKCTAQNKYGTDTRSLQLTLGVKPRIEKIAVQPSKSVSEGANVTLRCVAEGVPAPTYTWVSPTSDVHYSSDKRELYIRGATKSHEGNYECKVENKYASSKATETIAVTVKDPKSRDSRGERRGPSTAAILSALISLGLLYYLC